MKKGSRVSETEWLLRRVFRNDKRYVDHITGLPNSRAFAPRPKDEGKLSVDIKSLASFSGALIDGNKFRLFGFHASEVYKINLDCIYDPKDDNIAHALVIGFDAEDESAPGVLARKSKEFFQTDF